jgi:hypothetical protein
VSAPLPKSTRQAIADANKALCESLGYPEGTELIQVIEMGSYQ